MSEELLVCHVLLYNFYYNGFKVRRNEVKTKGAVLWAHSWAFWSLCCQTPSTAGRHGWHWVQNCWQAGSRWCLPLLSSGLSGQCPGSPRQEEDRPWGELRDVTGKEIPACWECPVWILFMLLTFCFSWMILIIDHLTFWDFKRKFSTYSFCTPDKSCASLIHCI